MGVSGRESSRVEAGHDHVGGRSPMGREVRECGKAGEQRGRGGASSPLIVGQISGAGHTWLLPCRCGVELRQNPNRIPLNYPLSYPLLCLCEF